MKKGQTLVLNDIFCPLPSLLRTPLVRTLTTPQSQIIELSNLVAKLPLYNNLTKISNENRLSGRFLSSYILNGQTTAGTKKIVKRKNLLFMFVEPLICLMLVKITKVLKH